MDEAVIVEGIGKKYRLGAASVGYGRLTEVVTNAVARGFRSDRKRPSKDEIWALKDVTFTVEEGEVVGIIGRNGAGKSTLLKILSQITDPTEGDVWLNGRVGSLLEVGTGFHPDLSGRENVFLNGAILGMRREETRRKFDEIVAFAEVEKFIDTPVKFYSSGMYVRLAFAVAAHLEPEILVVDEVLAVGDAAFQKKCLGKMGEVARGGRTVLFVSHNMAAVQSLCTHGVVLERGHVTFQGSQHDAVARYLTALAGPSLELADRADRNGTGTVEVTGIEFRDVDGNLLTAATSGQTVDVVLHYRRNGEVSPHRIVAGIAAKTELDVPVFLQHNRLSGDMFDEIPDEGAFVCRLVDLPLAPGSYRLTYSIMEDDEYLDRIDDAAQLTVIAGDFFGGAETPPPSHGPLLVRADWRVQAAGTAEVPAALVEGRG